MEAHTLSLKLFYTRILLLSSKSYIGNVKVSELLPALEVFFAILCSMLLIF